MAGRRWGYKYSYLSVVAGDGGGTRARYASNLQIMRPGDESELHQASSLVSPQGGVVPVGAHATL